MVNDFGTIMINWVGATLLKLLPNNDGFGCTTTHDWQKTCAESAVDNSQLESLPFTTVTSIGQVGRATGYTLKTLQLRF